MVSDQTVPLPRRRNAAVALARLAKAGVKGAHPDEWWGLVPLSDERPLAEAGEPVRVSPSSIESALRCGLRWLLERHGGAPPASVAQGVGNLVHAAAMMADDATADRDVLLKWLDERFDAIEHAAVWLAGPERERAESMVDKLVRWLANNPRRLIAIEREFMVRLGDAELRGRVDRLEVDEAGRLVVVDLVGKSTPSAAEVAEHPQLGPTKRHRGGCLPVRHRAWWRRAIQLGTVAETREQVQPALPEATDPGWAKALVTQTGRIMAAATFTAVRNDRCRVARYARASDSARGGRWCSRDPVLPGPRFTPYELARLLRIDRPTASRRR